MMVVKSHRTGNVRSMPAAEVEELRRLAIERGVSLTDVFDETEEARRG